MGVDETSLVLVDPYTVNVNTLESTASTPGVARVDINANGKGCHRVWYNCTLDDATAAPVLSTKRWRPRSVQNPEPKSERGTVASTCCW